MSLRPHLMFLAALLLLAACGRSESPPPSQPTLFAKALVDSAQALQDAGYELLDAGHRVEALAKFEEAEALLPTGYFEPYHGACAYAHEGDADEAFLWLDRALDGGFDLVPWAQWDDRLEPLREDPRFEDFLRRVREKYDTGIAGLAAGMPRYEEPPRSFAAVEELEEWEGEERGLLDANNGFLPQAEYVKRKVDLKARELAARRALMAGDPEWTEGLERVRAAFRIDTPYLPGWGAVADMVASEADAYLAGSPTEAGRAEAAYLAAAALSLRSPTDDPRRSEGYARAEAYLRQVPEGSEYTAVARALPLINGLQAPEADMATLKPRLREIYEAHPDDEQLRRALGIRLGGEAASVIWPIALEAEDLDGRPVRLDEYRGKVLLIDFWATWCPPCREELPGLVAAYENLHDRGFEVLSISLDFENRTTPEAYREWIAEHGMVWRHVYDGQGWQTPHTRSFLVMSIPAPFLVGKEGSLVAWGDACRGEQLVPTVEKALGGS